MRLIDADTLKAEFTGNFQNEYPVAQIKAIIDIMPTIEAEPVRHAKWEHPTNSIIARYCSLCGTRHVSGSANNFCPGCGAKMDGDCE